MKKISPGTAYYLALLLAFPGLVCLLHGSAEDTTLNYIGAALFAASLLLQFIFCRCPHCHRYLRYPRAFCPYCGKKLKQD